MGAVYRTYKIDQEVWQESSLARKQQARWQDNEERLSD